MTETFATKLKQMRKDLASIVDRMNRDRSFEIANAAQEALVAVDSISRAEPVGWLRDLDWEWQPQDSPEDNG